MDMHDLFEGYKKIVDQIYSPKKYYKRVKTFLLEYKAPKIEIPLDFQRVLAMFRSGIRLGILGEERFQYWKLMIWTLVRRPSLLSEAITFTIYGYHFRKVSKRYIL